MDSILQTYASPATFPASVTPFNFADDAEDFTYQQDMAKWRNDSLLKIDSMALEPTVAFKDADFTMASDPVRVQKLTTNSAFLQMFDGDGVPDEESDPVRQMVRATVARRLFDGRGAESEEAFHGEVMRFAQGRKDRRSLGADLEKAAQDDAALPSTESGGFSAFREKLKSHPGYDPAREADYLQEWNNNRRAASQKIDAFREPLVAIWRAFKAEAPITPVAYEVWSQLTPEQRPEFLDALAIRAKALPKEEQAKFWTNLTRTTDLALSDFGRQALEAAAATGLAQTATPSIDSATNERGIQIRQQAKQDFRSQRNFAADIRRIAREDYNPLRSADGSGKPPGFWEGVAYDTPGVTLTSLSMAVPVAGPAMMGLAMEGQAYEDTRARLLANGLSDEKASDWAEGLAPLIALPQAALEKVGFEMWAKKVPGFSAVVDSIGDRITNRLVRGLVKTTTIGAVETGVETLQDATGLVVQDIADALTADNLDVQWTGKGGAFDGFWAQAPETFLTMLPLSILGAAGGLNSEKRAEAFAQMTERQYVSLGGKAEEYPAFRDEMAKGPSSAMTAIDNFMASRNPTSPEAKAAVEAEVADITAQREAERGMEASGVLPRAVRAPDGKWTLYDTASGQEIASQQDWQGAARIASQYANFNSDADADRISALFSTYQAAEASGEWSAASDRSTDTVLDLGRSLTTDEAKAQSESARRRADAQERLDGGDGSVSRMVFGQSSTEMADGIYRTVNRILEGGSVLTVFHEEAHGFRRQARAKGIITQADDIAFLRAVDTVLGASRVRRGVTNEAGESSLALLPPTFDQLSPADQETAIDEGISRLMESEVIRSRKGGGVRNLPAGVVSNNLAAISRLVGDKRMGKFRSFIRAMREYFGLSIDRAAAIQRGLADGTLDKGQYDSYLQKLLGIDEQKAFEEQAMEAEADLLDGVTLDAVPEGDPFSLGPAALADALRGDVVSRIAAPEQRITFMSRISRNLEAISLQAKRLELLAGTKRMRKSLMKEAAMREATRAEELEQQAWARHYTLFEDDDLVKVKSQPLHALLADPASPLRGRLMSKSKAIEKHPDMFQLHRPGDYDGAEGVSRSVFGGNLMPDQAAQEAYDAGIIKEPTTDALWDKLRQEADSVASFKEMRKRATEDIRNARVQAKRETNDWLAEQVGNQEANFSAKEEIIRSLQMLDAILRVLPPEIRGRIGGYTQLARITSDELKLEYLKEKLQAVDVEVEKWLKSQYGREMEALLKRARPQKIEAGEKPRGVAGQDVHELFRLVEDFMGRTANEAEAEALKFDKLAEGEEITADQEAFYKQAASLIPMVANWLSLSAEKRESAVAEATRIFDEGFRKFKAELSAKRERRGKARDSLKAATGKAGVRTERVTRAIKDAKKIGRTLQAVLSLASFEQVVYHAFGEGTTEANHLIEWERRASNAKEDALQNTFDAVEDLFASLAGGKYKGEQLRWKLSQPATIKVMTAQGEEVFSEMEAVAATLMWSQEDGKRHMEGHIDDSGKPVGEWGWVQKNIDDIEAQLSKEAKAVRLHLQESYAAEYDRLNPVFRQLYGVSLPRHKNYSPLTVKPGNYQAGQVEDPVTGAGMSGVSLTPGALRNRMQTGVAEPDFRDALQTYFAHARQMEHFMAYAPFATEAMALINTRSIGNSVEASAGKETLSVLRSWLDHFAQGGNRDASAHLALNKGFNRAIGRVAAAALVGRSSVLVIQSLQLGAALAEMPVGSYAKRFAKLMTGQLGWGAAMKSEFVQRRRNQMPPLVRQALEGLMASKPNRLKYHIAKLGELIGGADALFTAGTYAIIHDYQKTQAEKLGLTGTEAESFAREAAERSTERVAQPTRTGTRSLYEATSTNPAMRLLWAFASEGRQKLALSGYALAHKPMGEKLRALAVTWIIGGAGAALIRAVMRDLRDDEDDELLDERNWDPTRLALAALTGPLQGLPIIGDVIEGAVWKTAGAFLPEGNMFSGVERAIDTAGKVPKWFSGDREWEDIIGDIDTIMGGFVPLSNTASAASSAGHLITDTAKILDNFFGN